MNKITIEEFEKKLIGFNGEKIRIADIGKYCEPSNLYINCRTVLEITEDTIPEEFFYGVYLISAEKIDKTVKKTFENKNMGFVKEILIFIGTEDGIHLDYQFYLANPFLLEDKYIDFLNHMKM